MRLLFILKKIRTKSSFLKHGVMYILKCHLSVVYHAEPVSRRRPWISDTQRTLRVHLHLRFTRIELLHELFARNRFYCTKQVHSHLLFISHQLFHSMQLQKMGTQPIINFFSPCKSWPNNKCECTCFVQYNQLLKNSSRNSLHVII